MSVSFLVLIFIVKMLPTVYFYHNFSLKAHKIYYIPANWLLPPELKPFQILSLQVIPKKVLGVCGVLAELFGYV